MHGLRESRIHPALPAGLIAACLLLGGCGDGADGAPGTPGPSSATVSGTVINATTLAPIAGAVIATDPVVPGVSLVTDATGAFSGELPIGPYVLSCSVTDYEDAAHTIGVVAEVPVVCDFEMDPLAPVILAVSSAPSGIGPGDTFDLTVTATPMDGSSVTGYQWTQTASAQADIQNSTSATATIALGDTAAYKAELLRHLDAQERWVVQGVNPFALEEAGHVAFTVDVTTTSGTYSETVDAHTAISFAATNPGLRATPTGKVVFLNGKTQPTYDWALTAPGGSSAVLVDGDTRNPWFLPDVPGTYTLTVTDLTESPPVVATVTIDVGDWVGGLTGIASDGLPTMSCAGCHPDTVDDWRQTGHAHILSNNVNTGGHYGTYCFACHTVGFDPAVDNGGVDDAGDYGAMTADIFPGGSSHPDPDNWDNLVANYPESARLTNIQCENCHGPNDTGLHLNGTVDEARIDLSSDVCATCHGEPPRHARFQQWEESGHASYELAIEEGEGFRGFCSKCHTANGFMEWLPILTDGDPSNDGSNPTVVLEAEEIHPQTCVVCHDPHNVGTTSGGETDAPVRIQGDTPLLMSGFRALSVGRGAMCMTCHNARRGLRNDDTWDDTKGSDPDRAPHGGPQTDVVMGQNLYFVDIGFRGPHGFIADTCVNCHMELTPPPAELSYNLGGTNHTFEASDAICGNCHGVFRAEEVQAVIERAMELLAESLQDSIRTEIGLQLAAGNWVEVGSVVITDVADVGAITLTEYHGRQAMDIVVDGQLVEHVRLGGDTEVFQAGSDPRNVKGSLLVNTDSTGGEIIARAGWNYWAAHSDGSHGVHNASFVGEALEAAIAALEQHFGS